MLLLLRAMAWIFAVLLGTMPLLASSFVIPRSMELSSSPLLTTATRNTNPQWIIVGSATKTESMKSGSLSLENSDYGDEIPVETDFVVVGGGPAGLLSAIMLAQKFPTEKIKLYDRLQPPPKPNDVDAWSDVAKFYLIGLGSRGQRALEQFGVLEEVIEHCITVAGRKDWAPDAEEGVEKIFDDRKVDTIVLARDKLVAVLYQHVLNNYADQIEMNYGFEVQPVDFGFDKATTSSSSTSNSRVVMRASQCSSTLSNGLSASEVKTASEQQQEMLCDTTNSTLVSSKLLLAADGTVRTIANAIQTNDEKRIESIQNPIKKLFAEPPFQVIRYEDDNRRIYKTIPMTLPPDWRGDINYSARSKDSRIVFDALPANDKNVYCGVLLVRETDSLAKPDTDPAEFRRELDEALPSFSAIIDDDVVAAVAKKPPSYLPAFRYAGPRIHQGDNILLLGDCIHTVKPYFGLGANSALEDVRILGDIIDQSDTLGEAVLQFSNLRAAEAKTLVRVSRELDRPGFLGVITFLVPVILDAIFSKTFPQVFSPNVITMLQRDGITFQEAARIKRLDRLAQVVILTGGLYGVVSAIKFLLLSLLATALGKA